MEMVDKRLLLQKAQTFYQQGRLDLAANEFLKIINLDPYNIVALNTLGDIYSRQSNAKQAFVIYQRVAKIYLEKGEYTKAIQVYKKILHVDQNNAFALYELGKMYENEGVMEDALDCYMKALQYMPKTEDAIIKDIYARMANLDPDNIELHVNLSQNFIAAGNKIEAKEEILTVIKAYLGKNDLKKAEEQLNVLSSIAGDEDILFAKGLIAQKKEDYVAAESLFKQVIAKNQYSVDAYYQLGNTRILSGREQQALIPFQTCLKYKPDFIQVLDFMGDNYKKQGKSEMAVEKYEKAVKSALDKSLFNEAKRILKKIIEADPNNVPALERLKSLGEDVEMGMQVSEAEIQKEVQKAAHVDEKSKIKVVNMDIPSVTIDFTKRRKIADLLDEAGKFQTGGLDEKADENYKAVLDIDPNNDAALNALAENNMMMGNNNEATEYLKTLMKVFVNRGEFERALNTFDRSKKLNPSDAELDLYYDEIQKRKSVIEQMRNTNIDEAALAEPEQVPEPMPEPESPAPEPTPPKPTHAPSAKSAPPKAESVKVDAAAMTSGGEENFVDNFADKVEEVIGDDAQGHFDMGMAFYSMQLFSKAIYELQLASKSDKFLVPSCEQIAQCFLDQGLPEASINWLNKALDKSGVEPSALLGIKFKLGQSYEALGDKNRAFQYYLEVYQENVKFQGVGKIIAKLKKELNVQKQATVGEEVSKGESLMDMLDSATAGNTAPSETPPPPAEGEKKKKDDTPPKQNPKISFL